MFMKILDALMALWGQSSKDDKKRLAIKKKVEQAEKLTVRINETIKLRDEGKITEAQLEGTKAHYEKKRKRKFDQALAKAWSLDDANLVGDLERMLAES